MLEVGDDIVQPFTTTDEATGLPVDPDSAAVTIVAPDRTVIQSTWPISSDYLIRVDVGSFKLIWTGTQPGRWSWSVETEGAGAGTGGGEVYVREVATASGLPQGMSLDVLKRRVDKELDDDDDLLLDFLHAAFAQASQPAPLGCGRLLTPDPPIDGTPDASLPVERTLPVVGRRHVLVPDAREITGVEVDGSAVAASGYDVLERNGLVVRLTLRDVTAIPGVGYDQQPPAPRTAVVTGRFGFATVPPDLAEAIYTLAARMYHERDARYADQVALADGGAVQAYYRQLPPRTKLAFASYALPTGIAGLP